VRRFHCVPLLFKVIHELLPLRMSDESIQLLEELSNIEPVGLLDASFNFSEGRMEKKGELDHYVGVAPTKRAPVTMINLKCPP